MRVGMPVESAVRTFLQGFRDRVSLSPLSPAVTQLDSTLTYDQLDRRSDALARYLATCGVGPGTLVGILLHRGPEMIVALLAILKAGAAYVPLDPSFPDDRLAYMLDDAAPAVVVTESSLEARLRPGVRTVSLDRDRQEIDARGSGPVDVAVQPQDRAYVIYTSGSTGRPKGVEITHGAVMNLLESFTVEPGLSASDVVLAHTTLAFDIAVIELWLPLFVGAHVLLAAPRRVADGHQLVDLLANQRVTFMQATPSMWRLLLGAGWRNGRHLKALSGAEPLPRSLADALLATGAQLWNVYGPTETTVWSSLWRVTADGPILIGRPIRNTELFVLDSSRKRVPDGHVGELCIGGAGLARGYLRRPALTAKRFVPHPFSAEPGARLYRTGDLARTRHDGNVECLGRLDHQVKIDGFRIELGEIEATLAAHADVAQVVVCAVEKEAADSRLVAYIVPGPSGPPRQTDLRRLARERLPDYMIPSAFVMMDALPLTPNGKLDRSALAPPDWRHLSRAAPEARPRTPLERRLRDLWCDVLGLEEVGIDENFFEIGGRSRLGAQLFARIETELGPRLPLATLFEAPTIEGLARTVERYAGDPSFGRWSPLVPIRPTGSTAPLFCIHPVGGNVLAYKDLARRLGPEVPCYGVQAVGLDGVTPPLHSVEEMAERYLHEIRSVQTRGPYCLCGFSFGGLVAFEIALRLRAAGEEVGVLALLDTDFPDLVWPKQFDGALEWRLVRERVYPIVQRSRRHLRSLGRLGIRGYLRLLGPRGSSATGASPLNGAPPRGADAIAQVAERVRKANTRAALRYAPRRYDGIVTYFRAQHAMLERDRRSDWSRLASRLDVIDVPGLHSDLRREPLVEIVARELAARLRAGRRATRVA